MSGGDVTDRDPNPTGQLINRQISHQHHVAPALSDMTLSPSPTLKDQFFESCNRNVLYKVRDSLGLGANVNWKRDPDGYSGLHNAAYHNYGELLELLLSQPGVNVNITNNRNQTPLMLACMEGHENIVRRLCQVNGIDPNIRDVYYGYTALYWAVHNRRGNKPRCVEILRTLPNVDWNIRTDC